MSDLEISKALALAIGWTLEQMAVEEYKFDGQMRGMVKLNTQHGGMRVFDYRDWNVIGPIAKRYRLVVDFGDNSVCDEFCGHYYEADTPQKAIALAVIGAK